MTNDFSAFTSASADDLVVAQTFFHGDYGLTISMPISVALREDSPCPEPGVSANSSADDFSDEDIFCVNYLTKRGNEISLVIFDAPEFSENPRAEDLAWLERFSLEIAVRASRFCPPLLKYTTIEEFTKIVYPLLLEAWKTQTWVDLVPYYPEELYRACR